ncbi:MAG: response regulator transcription factor [Clostridia bacterium]|nr:response regulator transcription factor [Clostridia bacterium]
MPAISILIAEDHAVVRESIHKLLEEEEDLVVIGEAANGEEVLRLAAELRPDVVLMDVSMPKLNGIEATRRLRQICPETAVLVLSAYDYDQYVFALLQAGAAGYLLKDVNARELIDAIRAVHRGEPVLHPAVVRKVVQRCGGTVNKTEQLPEPLTEREIEVLRLAAQGLRNKEIAQKLYVSVRTVETHFGNIFSKLGVNSRTEAILVGLQQGWLCLENGAEVQHECSVV